MKTDFIKQFTKELDNYIQENCWMKRKILLLLNAKLDHYFVSNYCLSRKKFLQFFDINYSVLMCCSIAFQWRDFVETNCIESWPFISEYSEEKGICIKSYIMKKIYYTFVTTTLFFIPVFVMITAYSLIVWRLWVNEVPGERSQSNVSVHKKAKKKVRFYQC